MAASDDRMKFAAYLAAQPDSRFGSKDTEVSRGSFAKYLDGSSGDRAASAMAMAQGTVATPDSGNEERTDAMAGQADAFLNGYMKQGIGNVMNTQNTALGTGYQGLTATQEVQQAKEEAAMQASMAQQGAMFDAIGTGLSIFGGIGKKNKWF